MAFYPCSNHHAPYRGPSAAAYSAIVDGSSSIRRHLRMCQPCFGDYLETVAQKLTEVDFDAKENADHPDSGGSACSFCGAIDASLACFVTAYPPKAPERAFYGRSCAKCEPKAVAELLLS